MTCCCLPKSPPWVEAVYAFILPIMSDPWRIMLVDDMSPIMFLYIMLLDDMSLSPIMLVDICCLMMPESWLMLYMLRRPIIPFLIMLRPIMLRPIMSRSIMLEYICWSIPILFMEDMSRSILYMSRPSSLSEDESMKEAILVLMRSGSTERLILEESALSLRMWKPWSSAM